MGKLYQSMVELARYMRLIDADEFSHEVGRTALFCSISCDTDSLPLLVDQRVVPITCIFVGIIQT